MTLRTTVITLSVMLFGVAAAGPEQVYDVMPSGVGTDADIIQAALENCAPGGTVTLGPGQFFLSHDVYVQNFNGTLQGAGKDETIITVDPAYYSEPRPLAYLGGDALEGFTFLFENPQGAVAVKDMTIEVGTPDVVAAFISLIGGDYDSTLQNLRLVGPIWISFEIYGGEGYAFGAFGQGTHTIKGCDIEDAQDARYHSWKNSSLTMGGGNPTDGNTINCSGSSWARAILAYDNYGGSMEFSNNTITTPGDPLFIRQPTHKLPDADYPPTNVLVTRNTLTTDPGWNSAVVVADEMSFYGRPNSLTAVVRQNHISSGWYAFNAIWILGAADSVVANNVLGGEALYCGIAIDADNCTLMGNQTSSIVTGLDAGIWLSRSTGSTVVGNHNSVLNSYAGAPGEHTIVGATNMMDPGSIGQELGDIMPEISGADRNPQP